ncbi:MAG: 1-(5-phosphoribosyl)-5-[(5-phosphoribosylamino)methylideneamino]imidazole-4-carboxamide isomerase [Pseudomonadota bacterium]|nr:1-(5-phosphoribosyl)-5-[(5-phosphoribosylamino)methylideneamino]imidazole-4-carboxamide isomerase [Pseudomonadota bacterium]
MLIIPAIDLKEGKCVRLRQGRMEDDTVFSEHPGEVAEHWVILGARRVHLVDLDGAFAGKPVNGDIVRSIASSFPEVPIQIGGGIRSLEVINYYLEAGVRFVIIGTKAVEDPDFVKQACKEFPKNIIVGIDAKDGYVATDGWAKVSEVKATDLGKQFEDCGVQSIIYTDISRDGMMQGVNIEQTKELAMSVKIPVIASGGVTNEDDIRQLCSYAEHNIGGVVVGRAIYEGTLDLEKAQRLADEIVPQHSIIIGDESQ